jgi:hypothetical protein
VAVEELAAAGGWLELALEGHTLGHGQGLLVQELGVEWSRREWHGAVEHTALVRLGRGSH